MYTVGSLGYLGWHDTNRTNPICQVTQGRHFAENRYMQRKIK